MFGSYKDKEIQELKNKLIELENRIIALESANKSLSSKLDNNTMTILRELKHIITLIQPKSKTHKLEEKIIEVVQYHGEISTGELIRVLGIKSKGTFYNALRKLEQKNIVTTYKWGIKRMVCLAESHEEIMESLVDL